MIASNSNKIIFFLTIPACFWIPIFFSNMNSNCSNLLDMRNLQEQVKKAFCYQKLFWPFTVWINCSSDLKNFANSRPSASNFKSFSRSLEQFFLTVGQNNFGNKIPFFNVHRRYRNSKSTVFKPYLATILKTLFPCFSCRYHQLDGLISSTTSPYHYGYIVNIRYKIFNIRLMESVRWHIYL